MTPAGSASSLQTSGPFFDPKKTCDCDCACGCDAKESSNHPVRFQNGQIEISLSDLGGGGFGLPWGHTRHYSNRLLEDDGLIELREYYTVTDLPSGAVEGEVQYEKIQRGSSGTPITLRRFEYTQHTADGRTVNPITKKTVYRNEDGTGAIDTSYSYNWHPGTVQMEERVTTLSAVPTSQNGSGVSNTRSERFDLQGNPIWTKDERGYITRHQYDAATGALVQTIQDAETTLLPDVPTGWMTPISGGLHLVTDYTHDELGRTIQTLGPAHEVDIAGAATQVRTATWTVYLEVVPGLPTVAQEIRTAQGYVDQVSSLDHLVNPVAITKLDQAGRTIEEIQATRASTSGKLTETDTFTQTSYVRWSTNSYDNEGRLKHTRVYHTIPSSGEGSSGTNYDQTEFAYDQMARQNKVTSPGGTITRTVFSSVGWASRPTATYLGTNDTAATDSDPTGAGDPNNNMVLVSESEYDNGASGGDGLLTKDTQHVDATTKREAVFLYDWRHRQTDIDGEEDFYQKNTHDNLDRVTYIDRHDTTANGNLIARSETKHDDLGRVYQTIRYGVDQSTGALTGETLTEDVKYDEAGNLVEQTPHGGAEFMQWAYDSLNRQISQTDPLSQVTQFAYNEAGERVSVTDPTGHTSEQVYDGIGRLVKSKDPLGNATTYEYNDAGLQFKVIDPGGNSTQYQYDDAGRETSVIDPLGKATDTAYDADGNAISVTDPNGNKTDFEYDFLGRLVKTTDPVGDETQSVYNRQGEVIQEIDAKGKTTTFSYDGLGRRTSMTDRLNGITLFAFDALGNQRSITDAEGQTTTYEFDGFGRLSKTAWPDHVPGKVPGDLDYGITQIEYDALGRVSRKTDQQGDTVTFIYDVAGRMIQRDYRTRANSPTGPIADSDTFTFDAAGRMLTAVSGRYSNTVTHDYDNAGRLKTEALTIGGQTYTVTRDYNSSSELTKLTYPDGSIVDRTYTARGQLHQVKYNSTLIDTRAYDDGGRMTQRTLGNGLVETRTYRDDDLVATIDTPGVTSFTYSYDANKNKTAETIGGVMSDYGFSAGATGYDDEDRLTTWNRTDGIKDQSWSLSLVGDWTTFTDESTTQTRTHGNAHELTAIDSNSVSHDAKGNLISNAVNGHACTWDFDNRLQQAVVPANSSQGQEGTHTYAYDALGRRVARTDSGTTTVYVNDDYQCIAEYSVGAQPTTPGEKYVYGVYIDELVLKDGTAGLVYYHHNSLVSVAALTTSSGSVAERYCYSAYGEIAIFDASGESRGSSAFNNPYRFDGYRYDSETDLCYVRARYFDPLLGQFVSRDPASYTDSLSLYQYVSGRPASLVDPFGDAGIPANLAQAITTELAAATTYGEALLVAKGWVSTLTALGITITSAELVRRFGPKGLSPPTVRPPVTTPRPISPRIPIQNLPGGLGAGLGAAGAATTGTAIVITESQLGAPIYNTGKDAIDAAIRGAKNLADKLARTAEKVAELCPSHCWIYALQVMHNQQLITTPGLDWQRPPKAKPFRPTAFLTHLDAAFHERKVGYREHSRFINKFNSDHGGTPSPQSSHLYEVRQFCQGMKSNLEQLSDCLRMGYGGVPRPGARSLRRVERKFLEQVQSSGRAFRKQFCERIERPGYDRTTRIRRKETNEKGSQRR